MSPGTKILAPSPNSRATRATARPWLPSVAATSESGRKGSSFCLKILDAFPTPEFLVPETLFQRPVNSPRRAEDLEGGQTEPARLVLDEDLADAQSVGESWSIYERRLLVAWQPAVES